MTYRADLWCFILRVAYDFEKRLGTLEMEPYNCCDMRGCISYFGGIDPAVKRIETFAGGVPDTFYVRSGRRWAAFESKKPGIDAPLRW